MEISDIKKIAEIDLYEILNINPNDDIKRIKKNYKKMVLRIHPDKPNGDRQIYELANLSYLVLKDEKTRKLYDHERNIFLESNRSFEDLKQGNRSNNIKLSKEEAHNEYKVQESILNKKHGFINDDLNPISQSEMMKRLNVLNFNRNDFINSHNKKIKNKNLSNYDFNEKFIIDGIVDENLSNEIIAFNEGNNMSISNYSGINNFDLYSNFSCSNSIYSSLDHAFNQKLPSILSNNYSDHNNINNNDRSIQKEKLANYNKQTNQINSMKINDFH